MISTFFKLFYDFSIYKKLAANHGKYAVWFLSLIFILAWAAGSAILVKFTKTEVPKIVRQVPAFEYQNGQLNINNFTDTKINLVNSGFYISYEPQRTFPPEVSDFVVENKIGIITKTTAYAFTGNAVKAYPLPKDKNYNYNPQQDTMPAVTEDIAKQAVELISGLSVATMFVMSGIILLSSVFLVFFVGLIFRGFNGRKVTAMQILKISAFLQAPMLILYVINFFIIQIPAFKLAQLCLAAIYMQQILSYYNLFGGAKNVTKS